MAEGLYRPRIQAAGSYRIGGGRGTVFDAELGPREAPLVSSVNASLRDIQGMLSQPLVLKHEGRFEISTFDFHFDAAVLRPTSAEVEINQGFMPGLTPRQLSVRSLADEPYGAFYIESHFTRMPMN